MSCFETKGKMTARLPKSATHPVIAEFLKNFTVGVEWDVSFATRIVPDKGQYNRPAEFSAGRLFINCVVYGKFYVMRLFRADFVDCFFDDLNAVQCRFTDFADPFVE